ncbi:MAG: hypothetical protein ACYTF1_00960, partial [Planctomycetota bacterium]
RIFHFFRRPLALAASLVFFIGAATFIGFWLNPGTTAEASVINYAVLLDDLAVDVNTAIQKFFDHYQAEPIEANAANSVAPDLSFAIPPELPGGYRMVQAYRLQFGPFTGIAARYLRNQEPLIVFFHPPMERTELGVHHESHCHVAGRDGHRVEAGPWRLIHFTDPTTCHCLLSKLDTESELLAVLSAVSPTFSNSNIMKK